MQLITLFSTLLSLDFVTATLLPKDVVSSRPGSSDGQGNWKRAEPAESSHTRHAQVSQPASSTEPVYVEQPGSSINSPPRLAIAVPRRLGDEAPRPMTAERAERLEAAQRAAVVEREARARGVVLTAQDLAVLRIHASRRQRPLTAEQMGILATVAAPDRHTPFHQGPLTAEQLEMLGNVASRHGQHHSSQGHEPLAAEPFEAVHHAGASGSSSRSRNPVGTSGHGTPFISPANMGQFQEFQESIRRHRRDSRHHEKRHLRKRMVTDGQAALVEHPGVDHSHHKRGLEVTKVQAAQQSEAHAVDNEKAKRTDPAESSHTPHASVSPRPTHPTVPTGPVLIEHPGVDLSRPHNQANALVLAVPRRLGEKVPKTLTFDELAKLQGQEHGQRARLEISAMRDTPITTEELEALERLGPLQGSQFKALIDDVYHQDAIRRHEEEMERQREVRQLEALKQQVRERRGRLTHHQLEALERQGPLSAFSLESYHRMEVSELQYELEREREAREAAGQARLCRFIEGCHFHHKRDIKTKNQAAQKSEILAVRDNEKTNRNAHWKRADVPILVKHPGVDLSRPYDKTNPPVLAVPRRLGEVAPKPLTVDELAKLQRGELLQREALERYIEHGQGEVTAAQLEELEHRGPLRGVHFQRLHHDVLVQEAPRWYYPRVRLQRVALELFLEHGEGHITAAQLEAVERRGPLRGVDFERLHHDVFLDDASRRHELRSNQQRVVLERKVYGNQGPLHSHQLDRLAREELFRGVTRGELEESARLAHQRWEARRAETHQRKAHGQIENLQRQVRENKGPLTSEQLVVLERQGPLERARLESLQHDVVREVRRQQASEQARQREVQVGEQAHEGARAGTSSRTRGPESNMPPEHENQQRDRGCKYQNCNIQIFHKRDTVFR